MIKAREYRAALAQYSLFPFQENSNEVSTTVELSTNTSRTSREASTDLVFRDVLISQYG